MYHVVYNLYVPALHVVYCYSYRQRRWPVLLTGEFIDVRSIFIVSVDDATDMIAEKR